VKNKDYALFEVKRHHDHRGFFYESFSKKISKEINLPFLQDNISYSQKGVIRGMHYQWDKPMGKLVHVIKGSIIDHILDIRKGSPSYGELFSFHISSNNNKMLWIPPGFAHGFESLQDSIIMYKCTSFYNKSGEGCIDIFDKKINLNLTIEPKHVIISEKDKKGISWEQYDREFKFTF
tara:strand:- start:73 stop:606 length:534 start_codon:yes stop_codon:yes gene_type:complete